MSEKTLITNFLEKIKMDFPNFKKDFLSIQKAAKFALKAHKGQKRKYSGGPFLEHPIKVALLSAKRFNDSKLVIASILHDTVEDNPNISFQELYSNFGYDIGFMVDSVTDNTNHFFYEKSQKIDNKIEKILYGGIKDVRCLLLKIHDRENNINTLSGLSTDKQIRMSFETQAIYEPLRKLFGINKTPKKTIKDCEILLNHYLKANKIQNAKDFKETLLSQTFYDFDNDTFDLVYKNTNRLQREIQDKKVFQKLAETNGFDEKIQVISIEQNIKGDFRAIIKYKGGNIFGNLKNKLKIHTKFS